MKITPRLDSYQKFTRSKEITLEQMKQIWNDEIESFTEEELVQIRNWLYFMADIIIDQINEDNVKLINTSIYNEEEKSNFIHPCLRVAA